MEPLLSIILTGRNDGYGDRFTKRLSLSLNLLASNLKSIGQLDSIEVVLVDWNSTETLLKELCLERDAIKITNCVRVKPEIANLHNYKKTPFHTTNSLNVGFEYAKGKFLSMMPADILWTSNALSNLINLLSGKALQKNILSNSLIGVPRKIIPNDFDDFFGDENFQTIDRFLTDNYFRFSYEYILPGINGGFGMFIFAKEMYKKLGGLRSDLGGWGWSDTDLGLKINQYGTIIEAGGYGVSCFDFAPSTNFKSQKSDRLNTYNILKLEYEDNFKDLRQHSFEIEKPKFCEHLLKHDFTEQDLKDCLQDKTVLKMVHKKLFLGKNVFLSKGIVLSLIAASFKPINYIEFNSFSYANYARAISPLISIFSCPKINQEYLVEFFKEPLSKKSNNQLSFLLGTKSNILKRVKEVSSSSRAVFWIDIKIMNIEEMLDLINYFNDQSIFIFDNYDEAFLKVLEGNGIKYFIDTTHSLILVSSFITNTEAMYSISGKISLKQKLCYRTCNIISFLNRGISKILNSISGFLLN